MSNVTPDPASRTADDRHADDRRQVGHRHEGHQRARGRAHARHRHQRVLLPPGAAGRRAVPAVPGVGREEPQAAAELPADLRRGHGRPHHRSAVDAGAQAAARVHAASTTRSTARSATRPASARCRSCTSSTTTPTRGSTRPRSTRPRSSTSARRSCSIRSAASCARAASATCDEVAGQHQLEFAHRGDHELLTTAPGEQLDNPYSLNTVDVCPVGALTAKDFRFTMRAWELEATPSVCNGCATGCNIEIHHKNGRAWRLVPRHNPDVNKYWMCDEGRLTYHPLREQRLAGATVDGLPAGWDRAIRAAADHLTPMLAASRQAVGGRAVGRVAPTRTTSRSASWPRRGASPPSTSLRGPTCRGAPTAGCGSPTSTPTAAASRLIAEALGLAARPVAEHRRPMSAAWSCSAPSCPGSPTAGCASWRSSRSRAHERGRGGDRQDRAAGGGVGRGGGHGDQRRGAACSGCMRRSRRPARRCRPGRRSSGSRRQQPRAPASSASRTRATCSRT